MNWTRRELWSAGVALLAGRGWAGVPKKNWSSDRLGIFCHLGTDEATARKTLAAARRAGFRRAQIFIPWARVSGAYLRSVPSWLRSEDIRAEVLSAYVNCCSPETVLMDCRREDFATAIETAGALGCRHLVAWTGGYGSSLMTSDPRNLAPAATDAIVRFLEGYTRRLEDAGLTLALETYITLACPDAVSLRRLLDRLPTCVGAVLDPPNLTPIQRFAERDQVMREMVETLRDRVAVVHLKDFALAEDGKSYDLPGPLGGELNYPLYANLILSLPGLPPITAEHLSPEEFGDARKKLLPLFEETAGRRS